QGDGGVPIRAQDNVAYLKFGVWPLNQNAVIHINQSKFSIFKDDDDPFGDERVG
ncbi:UNVERIFIED_CONTAM: hypothetical protein Sindi_1273400, partial [Sesamum indicum]